MTSLTKLIGPVAMIGIAVVLMSSTAVNANDDRARLAAAAHQLDRAAEHFHRSIHNRTRFSHVADDAHALAKMASHFHANVERGASVHHLARDLAKLRTRFWHLDHELDHTHSVHHSGHVLRDVQRIELALRSVSYQLTGPRPMPHDHHYGTGYIRIGPFVIYR